jgi:hypothetical protein
MSLRNSDPEELNDMSALSGLRAGFFFRFESFYHELGEVFTQDHRRAEAVDERHDLFFIFWKKSLAYPLI